MSRGTCFIGRTVLGIVMLLCMHGMTHADLVFQQQGSQSGHVEVGAYRAIYLGRLFDGIDLANASRFEGIYASVTIRDATDVALFAGNGSSDFENQLLSGWMVDTGARFSNTNATSVQVISAPSLPPPSNQGTPPLLLSETAGTTMASLVANGGLDFWLVADTTSNFSAPSSINPPGVPTSFVVTLTAIPEPASLILACFAGTLAAVRIRSRGRHSCGDQ